MPIYEYQRQDGTVFEILQKISEEPLTVCPDTGQPVKRLVSASAFHLKGSGWYKTDYASDSKAASSSTSTDSSSGTTDSNSSDSDGGKGKKNKETKTETKSSPETKSATKSCGTACGCH